MITSNELSQFYGTEKWYRTQNRRILATDGIKYLCDNGAGWLVDAVLSYQPELLKRTRCQEFQLWTLKVKADKTAVLTCQEDSNLPNLVEQKIEYTDFPLEIAGEKGFNVYVELTDVDEVKGNTYVILLPSER